MSPDQSPARTADPQSYAVETPAQRASAVPDGRRLTPPGAPHARSRRVVAWMVLAGGLTVAVGTLARPDGPMTWAAGLAVAVLGATTLASYVPASGWRPDLGCTPCAVVSGLSAPLAVVVMTAGGGAGIAAAIAAAGLVQRLRQPATCPA